MGAASRHHSECSDGCSIPLSRLLCGRTKYRGAVFTKECRLAASLATPAFVCPVAKSLWYASRIACLLQCQSHAVCWHRRCRLSLGKGRSGLWWEHSRAKCFLPQSIRTDAFWWEARAESCDPTTVYRSG